MSQNIISALKKIGPCLTSDLVEYLVTQESIPNSTARQRVVRAKGSIKKLAGLRLAKNARFIYLEEDYGNDRFWEALENALREKGPSYWSTIVTLKARGGMCRTADFPIVCGSPNFRQRQLPPEIILKRLLKINMLERKEVLHEGRNLSCIKFKPWGYQDVQEERVFRARMLAENIALNGVREWARRLGLGSYRKFQMRGEEELPLVAGVAWDLSAPSYIRPLVSMQQRSLKPGFFVCDLYSGSVNEDLVETFIRKYKVTTAPQNVAPVMALLVASEFEKPAFNRAKAANMLPVTVSNLFGKEVSQALQDLIQLLVDTTAAARSPDRLYKVLTNLSRIEGAANNLRGSMFGLVIRDLIEDVEKISALTEKKIEDINTHEEAEVDVILNKPSDDEVLVIECKSKIPGSEVGLSDVKRWYENRVPLINRILRQQEGYKDKNIRFELWTNGTFHHSANEWLNERKINFSNYSLMWKNGSEIAKYAQSSNNGTIKKILNEYYLRHPLAKLLK